MHFAKGTEAAVICKNKFIKNLSAFHVRSGSKSWLRDKTGHNSKEYHPSKKLHEREDKTFAQNKYERRRYKVNYCYFMMMAEAHVLPKGCLSRSPVSSKHCEPNQRTIC